RRDEIQRRFETDSKFLHDAHQRHVEEVRAWHEGQWNAAASAWGLGLGRARTAAQEVIAGSAGLFRPWGDPAWAAWVPPLTLPPALRFGEFRVSLPSLPGGPPQSERLKGATLEDFSLPALTSFPDRFCVLLEAGEDGRTESVALLQAMMFRLLTSLPP